MQAEKKLRPTSPKTRGSLFALWVLLGWTGAHRLYLGHSMHGALLMLLTLATCGVGGIVGMIDGAVLFFGKPKDAHGLPVENGVPVWATDIEAHALHPGEALAQLAFHLGVVFALPFLVGGAAGMFLDVNQVGDTAPMLFALGGIVLAPIFIVHVVGIGMKTREEVKLLKLVGELNTRTWLDAAARSSRMLTTRGFIVLATGLLFVVLALAYEWASLGVLAVLSLTAFYLATGASALLSAFLVRRFSSDALSRGSALHRRVSPGVVRAGDSATETIDIARVPVPPGFFLLLEGEWPGRVDTKVRHVVPPRARDEQVNVSTPLRITPRGAWDAAPLRVTFTDLLGLTRSSVASLATAKLKVLPAVKPAEIVEPPRSDIEDPDIVTRQHKFPTEELFRFREYVAGDDTRRIHWKLSMKTGKLQVKKPDSKETTTKRVLLALDTYVPPAWLSHTAILDDALDALVESWLSLAQRLTEDGQKVTLVLRARGDDGELHNEVIPCSRGNHAMQLDAGARAQWQGDAPIEFVLDAIAADPQFAAVAQNEGAFDSAVIVTMRLEAPGTLRTGAKEHTWVYLHPRDALGPPPPSAFNLWMNYDGEKRTGLAALSRFFLLPHPAGSDENGFGARVKDLERRLDDRTRRIELGRHIQLAGDEALTALLRSEDAVYRVESVAGRNRLRGLKGVTKRARLKPAYGTSAVDERGAA